GRQHELERPAAARQAPRGPRVRRLDPDVLRLQRLAQEDGLVAAADRADVTLLALELGRLVLGRVGDRASVRPPGVLADAGGRARQAARLAARERQEPDLREPG